MLRLLPLFALAAAITSLAQSGSGDLAGTITDASGAAISTASITLSSNSAVGVAIHTESTASGDFAIASLRPGLYTVRVTAPGFVTLVRSGVNIRTGQRERVNLALQPGAADQVVNVTADASLLATESGALATVISRDSITALPLNGRNIIPLTTLAPGVALPPGTLLPRINGGRPRTNEYLYDGVASLQPEPGQVAFFPIIDDIEEFAIMSSGVSAEFGRFNGGVINLTTRSGTSSFHGELYEFLRNEALNARNYFTPTTSRKPLFRRNQYGAALSGPVLPGRLFFFTDYQGTNQAVGVVRTSTIPTLAQRGYPDANGNPATGFNFSPTKIYDPATTVPNGSSYSRTEFPNDTIPVNRIDPVALALLKRYPLPTSSAATNNYVRVANDIDHQNQFDIRLDAQLSANDHGFARYTYFHDVEQLVTPLPDGSGVISGTILSTGNVTGLSRTLGQQYVANEIHSFNPRTVNEARFGYTRRALSRWGASIEGTSSGSLGIPGIPSNAAFNNALPVFAISGITQLGSSTSTFSNFSTSVTQVFDMVSLVRGQHAIKVGADLRWEHLDAVQPPNPTGNFGFSTLYTNQAGVTNTGNSLASFLLGQVNNFSIDLQNSTIRPRAHIAEFFAQDDWKATPRLTVNAGLRWTLNFPSTEEHNQGAVFNLATQKYQYLGKDGFSRSARELHYGNFGPRLGFSYMATPTTVVRSSYGIIFIEQTGITTPFTTPQFPFLQTVQQTSLDSIHPAFALSQGPSIAPIALDENAGLGQGVFTVNRKLGSGYVQQWNLAVQHELTRDLSIEVAYTGSVITRVGIPDTNLNQLTAEQLASGSALTETTDNPFYGQIPASSSIGGRTVSVAQLMKPYPRFLTVSAFRNNTGRTNYNAAELKLEKRTSYGLTATLSYTHSKLMDDASSVFDSSILTGPVANYPVADSFNPSLERDVSLGDMPNVTVGSAIYAIPLGRNHQYASTGIASWLLGGWNVDGLITLQSGMPFAVTQVTNFNAFAGFGTQRPTIHGPANLPADKRTVTHFINTEAFSITPQFKLGNASRDPARGPAYRDLDLGLVKNTPFGDRASLELRGEVFNVTNTPAFAQPASSVGTPNFGSITATTSDPRVVQVAAKLHF
ncbi:TonB-dependent receptor [Edaphobacter sp. 12200R-103]|uniref:TonB-dependent receptor n=1 Tax=Edaphobacter sp. 12200R-103 TaxID=2703788 RepID=UPI00138C5FFE|nr:TonB-dependent receptor [Edaphobacter sp. 12200R-103]QHS53052.1 TonB-dependent receptor [Edaphobacter sp. 12200R-103]